MALHHHQYFFKESPLLIVAPASKIKEQGWQRTIEEHYPNIKYEICTYNMVHKKYKDFKNYFVIFDECHRLKNSTGVWGKACYKLSKIACGYVLLSATTIPNGWEDSINYFKIFGLTQNKTRFLKENAIMTNEKGYAEVLGWRNENKLKNMWNLISKKLTKEEALDLPSLNFIDVFFNKSKEYNKIKKDRIFETEIYDNLMKLRHGLRMYCNLKDKLGYISDFIESTEDNIVIFYNYKDEYQEIKNIINKQIYTCNGQEKNYPKKDEWNKVKNTVTLANYKSGSEAVEFTYANIIIYFSPTESYTEFYQSYGRCFRNGQDKKVTCYRFITRNTIEEQIYNNLKQKQDFNVSLWEREVKNE